MFRCAFTLTLLLFLDVLAQNDSLHALNQNPATHDTVSDTTASLPEPIDKMPRVTFFAKAEYPDSLIAKGIKGPVLVDLVISEKGIVDSVILIKGLHPVLDSAAVRALKKFTFSPGVSQGKPIPVILRYAYSFTLEKSQKPFNTTGNLYGTVREKGTRNYVGQASIALSFEDTINPRKNNKKYACVDKNPEGVPINQYLKMLGNFPNQKFENGLLITTTDSSGRFSFFSVPCGTIHIKIIAGGYRVFTTKTVIKKDRLTKVGLWLERDSYSDNETVVYGKAEKEEIQSYNVAQQELRKVPGFNGEALKLVQALPGVARPVFAGNELIVRGSDNADSKVYIDGIQLPYFYHDMSPDFGFYRGILNTDALGSLSLYAGGWGVGFGNALGGIIDLSTRPARKDRWHGIFDFNIKSSEYLYESPLGNKAGIVASFREDFIGNQIYNYWSTHVLKEKINDISNYYDYSLRLDLQPTAAHHVFASLIGAHDTSFHYDIQWITSRKYDTTREASAFGKNLNLGIVGWDWKISPKFDNTLRYGIRPTSAMQFYNSWESSSFEQRSNGTRNDVRDELHYIFNDKLKLTLGIDLRIEPVNGVWIWSANDTVYTNSMHKLFGPFSGYLAGEWKITDRLTLTPGIRYDYYPQLRYNGSWLPEFWNYSDKTINNHTRFSGDPSLRVSGKYQLKPDQTLTASIGNYNQSPDSSIFDTGGFQHFGSEKGSQFTIGYKLKINDLVSLDCEGYFGMQWDKVRLTSAQERLEDNNYWARNGKARMEGLELLLRHDLSKHFSGWLSYSLAYSQRYDYGEQKWVEYDYNVLNNLQLVANWSFARTLGLGLRFQYTDGYPYTPQEVQYYDATNFYYAAKSGANNSLRHPPYLGLDLRFEKKWVYKRSMLTGYIEFERIVHWLTFVKKENGLPLYSPNESNEYYYDYSGFNGRPNFPMITFGLTWEL
jgi:TonB family C-terminal domain